MDDEAILGLVWAGQLFDGSHEWDERSDRIVKKPEKT